MLAVACWATQVRVIPSVQHAHLVTLDVIRSGYPALTGPTPPGWPQFRQGEANAMDDPEEPAIADLWGEPPVRSG
jgi:hypothetical protein